MRKVLLAALTVFCMLSAQAKKVISSLTFNSDKGVKSSLTMPNGQIVNYTAYTKLYYVTNIEDSTYQYMNIFVPECANQQSPIFLRTYIGGYMESEAGVPQTGDASGRALADGYVLVIPGSRGRQSVVVNGKKKIYTGRAPKALLDLKAAIRYIRHFDNVIPGNAERIITDGTSAGGAMSALMGSTGNNPIYNKYLKAMGAADERDDVFASVCFCPITDLEHADMTYEWLYGNTESRKSLSNNKQQLTKELSNQFKDYINSLGLKKEDGKSLNVDNYLDYIKEIIIKNAQEAKDAGATIPDTIGFNFSDNAMFQTPVNGVAMEMIKFSGMPKLPKLSKGMMPHFGKQTGEYITDLDMSKYLNYVVSTQPLKGVPAFDSYGVDGAEASGENGEFGNDNGSNANFTQWAADKTSTVLSDEIKDNVYMMNPMNFIGDNQTTVASHWYIRHGARDRDTAFPIAINLATKLENNNKDVNFKLAWNRPHSGDYSLNELFEWIKTIVQCKPL
nr:alpha/beta hydrolase [Prevotella sp.]